MQRGVVCMIDALGFKGIWETESPDAILERLRGLRDFLLERAERATVKWSEQFAPYTESPPRCSALSLSDSIALTIEFGARNAQREKLPPYEGSMVQMCAYIIGQMLHVAARAEPSLAYRGAIAVGDFATEDTFLIGPAVDEAAKWMNEADAAAVVLVPGETKRLEGVARAWDNQLTNMFMDYSVPLKDKAPIPLRVLNPFILCKDRMEEHDFIDGTKTAFRRSSAPEVQRKLTNTLQLFETGRRLAAQVRA